MSVSSRVCERQRHCAYASEWVVSCHINYGQGLSFIQNNLLKLYLKNNFLLYGGHLNIYRLLQIFHLYLFKISEKINKQTNK